MVGQPGVKGENVHDFMLFSPFSIFVWGENVHDFMMGERAGQSCHKGGKCT